MIYLWSPRYVYSVKDFQIFRDAAAKKGMEFIAVLDPQVSVEEAQAAVEKTNQEMKPTKRKMASLETFKGRKLASVELFMRDGMVHYPTVFVVKNGKMNPHGLPGILTPPLLSKLLDQRMGDIK
jgi:hypothetical protein